MSVQNLDGLEVVMICSAVECCEPALAVTSRMQRVFTQKDGNENYYIHTYSSRKRA